MNYKELSGSADKYPVSVKWQKQGLIGISKKIPIKTKFLKGTKIQLMYDFLSKTHYPQTQPVLFRTGYIF